MLTHHITKTYEMAQIVCNSYEHYGELQIAIPGSCQSLQYATWEFA